MKRILGTNIFFFLPTAFFLLLLTSIVFFVDKTQAHLYINSHHSTFTDFFFKYATELGNGLLILITCIALLFVRYHSTLMLLVAYLLSSLITQGLKHLVFVDSLRPKRFFEEAGTTQLDFVNGIDVHSFNSMPSGHTATAFCLFCMLALITPKKWLGLICCILAILAGFSRVYLNQHFLEDILAGAIIGALSSLLVFYFMGEKGKMGFLSGSLRRNS